MIGSLLRVTAFLLLSALCAATSAQTLGYNKHSIALNQDFRDFNVVILDKKLTSFDSALSNTFRISYFLRLNPSWQLNFGLSNGILNNQIERGKLVKKSFMTGVDADLVFRTDNGKLLPAKSAIAPYLTFGYNINHIKGFAKENLKPWRLSNEFGFGLAFKVAPMSSILTKIALDQQLNGDFDTHIQYRIGYKHNFLKHYKKPYDFTPDLFKKDYQPILSALDSLRMQLLMLHNRVNSLEEDLDKLDDYLVQIVYFKPDSQDTVDIVEEPQIDTEKHTASDDSEEDDSDKEDVAIVKKTSKKADIPIVESATEKSPNQPDAPTPSTKEVKSEQTDQNLQYYVVVMSSVKASIVEATFEKYNKIYPGVTKLPQKSGFTRIGIRSGTSRSQALHDLKNIKKFSEPKAWLSLE